MKDRDGRTMTEQEISSELAKLRDLREQFFPNSFIYEGREISGDVKPWYKVTAGTKEELDLAKLLQPSNVTAEFVLIEKK